MLRHEPSSNLISLETVTMPDAENHQVRWNGQLISYEIRKHNNSKIKYDYSFTLRVDGDRRDETTYEITKYDFRTVAQAAVIGHEGLVPVVLQIRQKKIGWIKVTTQSRLCINGKVIFRPPGETD